jgi:membrane protease YdiL (CAAX protease family)
VGSDCSGYEGIGLVIVFLVFYLRGFRHCIDFRMPSFFFPSQFGLALCISSLLFGVMHQRWIAGALSGAVYCLLVCRSNKLADAVVAHGMSNAAIVFWAIAAGQYSLL